jgi:phosphate:Na+ symporter
MTEILFPFVGGIGLFLIGMMLLSEGLVAFGGGMMKQALARFTATPLSAFMSGTVATILVQSSTATTVTLIGFVSAGLITFTQAIGVLIGASLGNTGTGWIVATLGLKINLGFYTLPLIGIGAMLRLMAKGKWSNLGVALAGFGLMFVGLNTLQEGMQGAASVFNLANLPAGGYGARMLIMLFGLALTAVLQSSTAAVATILTALHTQTINFDQAAALVVGAAIGTTLTGALVAIGGTIYAKRTALAYILFNLVAGLIAIFLMPVFLSVINWFSRDVGLEVGATSLAAFHTLFIAVGAALFMPFIAQFARIVERMLPEKNPTHTQHLDDSMLSIPSVALEASQRALETMTERLLGHYQHLLAGAADKDSAKELHQASQSLDEIYVFISRIVLPADDVRANAMRIAQLHAIDHLLRFRIRLHDLTVANVNLTETGYQWAIENSRQILALAQQGLDNHDLGTYLQQLELNAVALTHLSREVRHQWLETSFSAAGNTAQALTQTDIFRWLERTGHHIWRISYYLAQGRNATSDTPQSVTLPEMKESLGQG